MPLHVTQLRPWIFIVLRYCFAQPLQDWLELNARADLLLFRDKRRQLHLYDCHKQARTTLLSYCNYVQWVPESDVVVGQNRDNLNVWYNIDQPEKVTVYPIKGTSFLLYI